MRFMKDDQRKAMFAQLNGCAGSHTSGKCADFTHMNKFSADLYARKSTLEMVGEDLVGGDSKSELFVPEKVAVPLKLPDGTQAAFLVSDYGSYIKTKAAALEAKNALESGDQKADVVPIWDGKELKGHAVTTYTRGGGSSPRQYLPGVTDVESAAQANIGFIKEQFEKLPEKEPVTQPPLKDKYREYEARLLSSGVSREDAAKEAEALRTYEGDETERGYLDALLGAFESSGDEDFYRFKKKFDVEYKGRKSSFSKKSKEDYFAVIQRGDDEYVCSFCGDVFSNRVTAAKHAGRCDGNSFNDKDTEYEEEDSFDEDDSAPDGFSV